jgi:hypothetical protein
MMKTRYHILIWLALAISLYSLSRTFTLFPRKVVHDDSSNSAYAAATAGYMRKCLSLLQLEANAVHFIFPNKNFGVVKKLTPDPNHPELKYDQWSGDFTLRVNETFLHRPDHHQSTTYTLEKIEPTGIVIRYESRFDHRSFGKNLINVNRGTLRLPWKEEEANKKVDPIN